MSCHRPERGAHAPLREPERANPPPGEPASAPAADPSRRAPSGPACDLCGATMYASHCKLICPACGYTRDCSDP